MCEASFAHSFFMTINRLICFFWQRHLSWSYRIVQQITINANAVKPTNYGCRHSERTLSEAEGKAEESLMRCFDCKLIPHFLLNMTITPKGELYHFGDGPVLV